MYQLNAATLQDYADVYGVTMSIADDTVDGTEAAPYSYGIRSIGDVNGDGVQDIAAISMGANEERGAVLVYLGKRV